MGLTDGVTGRSIGQLDMERLLAAGVGFLRRFLGTFVGGDGNLSIASSSNTLRTCYRLLQGRACGHDSLALLGSMAARRCGLGGLLFADARRWTVMLQGPEMPQLSQLMLQPSKQLPGHDARGTTRPGAHLRQFRVAQASPGAVLCVELRLSSGVRMLQTAEGVLLQLGLQSSGGMLRHPCHGLRRWMDLPS